MVPTELELPGWSLFAMIDIILTPTGTSSVRKLADLDRCLHYTRDAFVVVMHGVDVVSVHKCYYPAERDYSVV